MRKKNFGLVALAAAVMLAQTCAAPSIYRYAPEELSVPAKGRVVVALRDGTGVAVRNVRMVNGKLVGVADNKKIREIDVNSIAEVRLEKSDMHFLILYGAVAIVELLLAVGETNAPPPPPSQSCPFVFSFDGESFVLDAEPFGAAVCRGLERTEWCELEHLRPVEGRYRLLVSNLLRETQHIDEMKLLVADHPKDVVAACDPGGGVHAFRRPLPPRSAVDGRGRDVASLLAEADRSVWRPGYEDVNEESANPLNLKGELTLEFPKPREARSAKLLIKAATTPWGSQVAEEILKLHGSGISDWYEEMNARGPALYRTLSWFAREELYLLQLRVETARGWESRGLVYGAGPFVSEKKAYVLDVRDLPGEVLRVKLTPPLGFWEIDQVNVAYDEDAPVSVRELGALQATDQDGSDVRELLAMNDDRYHVMPDIGNSVELVFDAPPVPPDSVRTVFLKAAGYYEIHLEGQGTRRADVVESLMTTPGATLQFAHRLHLRSGSKPGL